MDNAQVITAADHDGWVTYFVIPADIADDIVSLDDVYKRIDDGDCDIKQFRSPIDFAEWHAESDVELTSYWETRRP